MRWRGCSRAIWPHLAGNPTVIVQNMPGAGSMVATMNLFHTAPKDGTTLGMIGGGTVRAASRQSAGQI